MKQRIWVMALVIGVVNAIVLYVFELIGVNLTNWLWNDLLGTDVHRWRVLPVAWVLGLLFTAVILLFRSKRVVPPESDLLKEMDDAPSTISAIGVVLAIGAMALLAGASLGPEASLVSASAAIGAYAASRSRLGQVKQLLVLASIGALLVAFIDSMVLVLIPLLVLWQSEKKHGRGVQPKPVVIILLASLTSFVATHVIDALTGGSGYGTAPAMPHFQPRDFIIALLLGFIAGFLALCLNWLIQKFYKFAKQLDARKLPAHDWLVGLVLSTGLGVLYLFGGRTIEFSGEIGSSLLAQNAAHYGALALVGLVAVKVFATAWSKGTGYRGGLVFPSIYIGVALGLMVGHLWSGFAGAGAMIGGIAGTISAAVDSPIVGGIFLLAILPYKLWPVALCAILGTMLFSRIFKRLQLKLSHS